MAKGPATPRPVIEDRKRRIKETADLVIGPMKKPKKYKMDLIPPALVVARCFPEDRALVNEFLVRKDAASRELAEFVEEHSAAADGDEGPLAVTVHDKGKVTKASVNELLKVLSADPECDEDREILRRCLSLLDAASSAGKAAKEAQAALAERTLSRYATLTEAEIKTLVIEDKWLASLQTAVTVEAARRVQCLAARIGTLEDRYAEPLPQIECKVETDAATVTGHLKRMGLSL